MLKELPDAAETYRRMRSIRPDLKVLLLSGYSNAQETQELLGAGAIGHLQKPYSPDALLRGVRQALDAPK